MIEYNSVQYVFVIFLNCEIGPKLYKVYKYTRMYFFKYSRVTKCKVNSGWIGLIIIFFYSYWIIMKVFFIAIRG
jgi:hypothetical protein